MKEILSAKKLTELLSTKSSVRIFNFAPYLSSISQRKTEALEWTWKSKKITSILT